jgi:hypothetical protein
MAVKTFQYALVQDAPVRLVPKHHMPQEVHVHNHEHSGSRDLYIGAGSAVSDANGHHVLASTDMIMTLHPNQELWGMTPTGAGCDVTVLVIQKDN